MLVGRKSPAFAEMPELLSMTPEDLGWDSIDEATMALELAELMGLEMVPDDIEGLSFEELAQAFEKALR